MIGCLVLGTVAVVGLARLAHRRRCWHLAYAGCQPGFGGWSGGPGGGWRRWHGFAGPVPAPGAEPDGDPLDPDDEPGGWGGAAGRFARPGGFMVDAVLDRIDASPAQERVIKQAVADFRDELRGLRAPLKQSRAQLAAALRKPAFDEVLLGELFAQHDDVIEKGRKAFVGLMAKTHEALEDKQRQDLAALVERGPGVLRGLLHRFWRRRANW